MSSILITGVTGNLGSAVATRFLKDNYEVFGIARKNDRLRFSGSSFHFIAADLGDEDAGRQAVETAIKAAGHLDVAVLTAGGFAAGDIHRMNRQQLREMMQLNVETTLNAARPIFSHMMEQGSGRLFLTGARTGLHMSQAKTAVAYGLSKSLIFHLAEILNAEAKNSNVVVSVIVPSIIDTPQNREAMPEADYSSWVTPESIAETIYYYAGAAADSIREPVIKVYNKA